MCVVITEKMGHMSEAIIVAARPDTLIARSTILQAALTQRATAAHIHAENNFVGTK